MAYRLTWINCVKFICGNTVPNYTKALTTCTNKWFYGLVLIFYKMRLFILQYWIIFKDKEVNNWNLAPVQCNDDTIYHFLKSMQSKYIWLYENLRTTSSITLCMIFTTLLTLWNSEQKNELMIKLFCFSSDFDETWWNCSRHG